MPQAQLRAQNVTLTGTLPLDRPHPDRPHRLYFALTNHCNRACPWCSTCSTPSRGTWLTLDAYRACFPESGAFEVQLEGGEPTTHPDFLAFVGSARSHPRCSRVVVVTNGVLVPRDAVALRSWLEQLGAPLTLKLSINHHLLARDAGLLDLAGALRDAIAALGGDRALVLNVRLRKGRADDDRSVVDAVAAAGLTGFANIFFLQRYGFGDRYPDWDEPFIVGENFSLINPDGTLFAGDLVGRSDAMRRLD